MRIVSYSRDRQDLINAALCYPQGLAAADFPAQVFASTVSIDDYGRHSANPMSDLITGDYAGPGTISPSFTANDAVCSVRSVVGREQEGSADLADSVAA